MQNIILRTKLIHCRFLEISTRMEWVVDGEMAMSNTAYTNPVVVHIIMDYTHQQMMMAVAGYSSE